MQSEAVNELYTALATAQGAFVNPERNRTVKVQMKTGGTYTFAYATLDAILDMARAPLSTNGLSLSHHLGRDEHGHYCATVLGHSSGQSIECRVPLIVDEHANAQGWGSAISYARRYGVTTLLSIAADEDDDGNAACGHRAEPVTPRRSPAKPVVPLDAAPPAIPPAPKPGAPEEAAVPHPKPADIAERFAKATEYIETCKGSATKLTAAAERLKQQTEFTKAQIHELRLAVLKGLKLLDPAAYTPEEWGPVREVFVDLVGACDDEKE